MTNNPAPNPKPGFPEQESPFQLFPILHSHLDQLAAKLRSHKRTNIASKVLSGFHVPGGPAPSGDKLEISGSRLSKNLQNKEAAECSAKLLRDPLDSTTRLQLLDVFLTVAEQAELEASRDAYLLALLELESPLLSSKKINTAFATQTFYLKKLFSQLNSDFQNVKQKIQDTDSATDRMLDEQVKRMKTGVGFMQTCFTILEAQPIRKFHELDLRPGKVGKNISTDDLNHGYDPFLKTLCFIPPAETARQQLLEILHLLESKNPLVGFHEAKMNEILARIEFAEAQVTHDSAKVKNAVALLSKAIHAISTAVGFIGYSPNKSLDVAVLNRYGQLCYFTARVYRLHQIPLPNEHLERMKKAVELLGKAVDDPNVKSIQTKLMHFLQQ